MCFFSDEDLLFRTRPPANALAGGLVCWEAIHQKDRAKHGLFLMNVFSRTCAGKNTPTRVFSRRKSAKPARIDPRKNFVFAGAPFIG